MDPNIHIAAILRADGDPDPVATRARAHDLVLHIEEAIELGRDPVPLRQHDARLLLRWIRNGVLVNAELEALYDHARWRARVDLLGHAIAVGAVLAALTWALFR